MFECSLSAVWRPCRVILGNMSLGHVWGISTTDVKVLSAVTSLQLLHIHFCVTNYLQGWKSLLVLLGWINDFWPKLLKHAASFRTSFYLPENNHLCDYIPFHKMKFGLKIKGSLSQIRSHICVSTTWQKYLLRWNWCRSRYVFWE